MNKTWDLNTIAKFFITLIIAANIGYAFYGMSNMSAADSQKQAEKMMQIIDRALVQCYALEGAYPSDGEFKDKMAKYGVILNEEKYHFYYSAFSANIKPDVAVIPKL